MKVSAIRIAAVLSLSGAVSSLNPTHQNSHRPSSSSVSSRRQWIATASAAVPALSILLNPSRTNAAETATSPLEMKNFIDPQGLFSLRVPSTFFTLRRTVKGDLPDEKTGKGRRGSSIFTAGNMAKAEVVAVERCVSK
jgi:hypothetical protein